MKKSISVILCLSLVLCSLFSISSVAFAAEAPTAKSLLDVKTDGVFYDTITYTVYLKAGVNTAGAVVEAVYDPNVLEVVSAGQAQNSPISGYYTPGAKYDRNDMYNIGYIGFNDYKNGSKDTAFMQFTFKVKGTARPVTSVYFYCNQFSSDSQPQNEISGVGQEAFYTWTGTTLSTTHVTGATMFEGGVTVEWEPTIGATGYVVYKVINDSWTEIARTTDCLYVDYDVVNNTNYQYTVRAYNETGLNSSFEQGVSICYLLAPSLLWLSPSGNNVMASWPAMEGITTYRLYRRAVYENGDRGEWIDVGTTDKTSYVDSTATLLHWNNHEYSVCSVSGNNESPKYTLAQIRTNTRPNVTLSLGGDNVWHCYTNGLLNKDYRGLVEYGGSWYYVEKGAVDWSYTGFVEYDSEKYYVLNGYLDWNITTLVCYDGVWYYVENGCINTNITTLCYYNGEWYYVENGVVNWDYTGLVEYGGVWYHVVNGYLDWRVTTLTYYDGYWYYVENGAVNWNATTLCFYNGDWYYVQSGTVNWNYTGLVEYNNTWYYVVNSFLDWGVTTITFYNGDWYYVENGEVNWSEKTLCYYAGDWYYVENGVVNWNYTGLVEYNGTWYYVVNGFLDWSITTLTYYNGDWYYIENGAINWGSDTLCYYVDGWYYVKNGMVAFDYTGTVMYNGESVEVVNGYATV